MSRVPDPQADLAAAFSAGLDAYYGHGGLHESRGDLVEGARAVLAALGNPHERVAELERENSELESQLRGADQLARVDADMLDEFNTRVLQLLRDLKAIEERAEDFAHIPASERITHVRWNLIRSMAREAQATDEQLGPENNQIAT